MYEGRRYCNHALDVYYHAAVALEPDKYALGALERSSQDAHTVAVGKVTWLGIEVDELLVVGACDGDEAFHLLWRNDYGQVLLFVHDVADGHLGVHLVVLHARWLDKDKNEVVNCRFKALHEFAVALDGTVVHGNKILDAHAVEFLLHLHFTVVGNPYGVPFFMFLHIYLSLTYKGRKKA